MCYYKDCEYYLYNENDPKFPERCLNELDCINCKRLRKGLRFVDLDGESEYYGD